QEAGLGSRRGTRPVAAGLPLPFTIGIMKLRFPLKPKERAAAVAVEFAFASGIGSRNTSPLLSTSRYSDVRFESQRVAGDHLCPRGRRLRASRTRLARR